MLATAIWLFAKKQKRLSLISSWEKDENYSDRPAERWKNLLLLAFGQKKMFRNPLVAVMHFVIYAGFLIINIEVLEILLDGIFGTHRLFVPFLGGFYNFVINFFESLAVGIIIVCVVFLARRNIVKVRRLSTRELKAGWPRRMRTIF